MERGPQSVSPQAGRARDTAGVRARHAVGTAQGLPRRLPVQHVDRPVLLAVLAGHLALPAAVLELDRAQLYHGRRLAPGKHTIAEAAVGGRKSCRRHLFATYTPAHAARGTDAAGAAQRRAGSAIARRARAGAGPVHTAPGCLYAPRAADAGAHGATLGKPVGLEPRGTESRHAERRGLSLAAHTRCERALPGQQRRVACAARRSATAPHHDTHDIQARAALAAGRCAVPAPRANRAWRVRRRVPRQAYSVEYARRAQGDRHGYAGRRRVRDPPRGRTAEPDAPGPPQKYRAVLGLLALGPDAVYCDGLCRRRQRPNFGTFSC